MTIKREAQISKSEMNWNAILSLTSQYKDPQMSYKYNKDFRFRLNTYFNKLNDIEKEKIKGYWEDLTGQVFPITELLELKFQNFEKFANNTKG